MVTSSEPNVVGVNVLKQNGVDIDELIRLLIYNASVEFTAYYYFTNLRMHCTGVDGEGIKGVIEDARLEDLSHFESCLSRIKAEQGAIVNWNKICQMTHGKDPATYDVAKDILREEIEHEAWFLELLYGRPSAHMRRKFPGERPHTHKHSRALG
jgi:ferritin-like protein